MKRIALILACCIAVAAFTHRPADAEPSLGIGSNAPALDIEHYIDEGDQRVTAFKPGTVYVVEFWATWCGPCVMSMPHLSELQTKFRNSDVQILSITDEDLETVTKKLAEDHPVADGTYADVTAAYTLAADPDGSTHKDYMEAAEQPGIPTSFIVGKSGLIEWIGHPMELDDPLAAVVEDRWDREAFKKELEQRQLLEQMQMLVQRGRLEDAEKLARLNIPKTTNPEIKSQWQLMLLQVYVNQAKYDEAIAMAGDQVAETQDPELKQLWTSIWHQIRLLSGKANQQDFDFYRADLKQRVGNGQAVIQFAGMMYNLYQNGGNIGPLGGEAIKALENEIDGQKDEMKVGMYELIARLHALDEDFDQALAAQQKGAEIAKDLSRDVSKRAALFLDELKSKVEGAGEGESGK